MNKMQKALRELAEMDELAARTSPVHALHPAAKLWLQLHTFWSRSLLTSMT